MKMANLSLSENVEYITVCQTEKFELKMVQKLPSKIYLLHTLALFISNNFLSLSTILLNFVTIATFCSSSHLRKKAYYSPILQRLSHWADSFTTFFNIHWRIFCERSQLRCVFCFLYHVLYNGWFFRHHIIRHESRTICEHCAPSLPPK